MTGGLFPLSIETIVLMILNLSALIRIMADRYRLKHELKDNYFKLSVTKMLDHYKYQRSL